MINGRQFCISGDQACVLRPWMQVGYKRKHATAGELAYNAEMNGKRIAVEWSYGAVKSSFATFRTQDASAEGSCWYAVRSSCYTL